LNSSSIMGYILRDRKGSRSESVYLTAAERKEERKDEKHGAIFLVDRHEEDGKGVIKPGDAPKDELRKGDGGRVKRSSAQ